MPHLFQKLTLRGVELPNRVMVSPMCTNHAPDSVATAFHMVHIGRFALGGAGLIIMEATAVAPEGRIGPRDLGLWNDEQAEKLAPIAAFVKQFGSVPGIQLAHAGRKGSTAPATLGASPLASTDHKNEGWDLVAPSPISPGPGWPTPVEMSEEDILASIDDWRMAARRAVAAGFDVVDIHGAHGYLLHSFLSPIANQRTDEYGGAWENRMRFALAVARAIREELGPERVLGYRVSAVDGLKGGLTMTDTISFVTRLKEIGVDFIDTSSSGIVTDRSIDTRVRRGYSFHAPFSAEIRKHVDMAVATVGLVVDPEQAEQLLRRGDADLIAVGREMLYNPHWAHHARGALASETWETWYNPAQRHLQLRADLIDRLAQAGEDPLTRYDLAPEYL